MLEATTVAAAWLSLIVSAVIGWFTLFRKGSVRMTQPAYIFFGPDGINQTGGPKIAMCAHLYSTAQRGSIIEGMFIRLKHGGKIQDFDVWVYGASALSRGSGVYVGQEGVTCSHHFLLPSPSDEFDFKAGQYTVEIFGTVVGTKQRIRFWQMDLFLDEAIPERGAGVYFDWRPAKGAYEARIDERPLRAERLIAVQN